MYEEASNKRPRDEDDDDEDEEYENRLTAHIKGHLFSMLVEPKAHHHVMNLRSLWNNLDSYK